MIGSYNFQHTTDIALSECKNRTDLNQGSQQNEVLTACRSSSCYYKPHGVNWPLIYFYLVLLSFLKSPALANDYWKVINTTVTEGSKHFPHTITNRGVPF